MEELFILLYLTAVGLLFDTMLKKKVFQDVFHSKLKKKKQIDDNRDSEYFRNKFLEDLYKSKILDISKVHKQLDSIELEIESYQNNNLLIRTDSYKRLLSRKKELEYLMEVHRICSIYQDDYPHYKVIDINTFKELTFKYFTNPDVRYMGKNTFYNVEDKLSKEDVEDIKNFHLDTYDDLRPISIVFKNYSYSYDDHFILLHPIKYTGEDEMIKVHLSLKDVFKDGIDTNDIGYILITSYNP